MVNWEVDVVATKAVFFIYILAICIKKQKVMRNNNAFHPEDGFESQSRIVKPNDINKDSAVAMKRKPECLKFPVSQFTVHLIARTLSSFELFKSLDLSVTFALAFIGERLRGCLFRVLTHIMLSTWLYFSTHSVNHDLSLLSLFIIYSQLSRQRPLSNHSIAQRSNLVHCYQSSNSYQRLLINWF